MKIAISLLGLLVAMTCGAPKLIETNPENIKTAEPGGPEGLKAKIEPKVSIDGFTSAKNIESIMSFLASDELKGRDSGSEGIEIAAKYIEKHFAETGKSLYSSHMIDLSEEPIEENIEICKQYLKRMSKMGMTLEIELGITGGEEDGVDNTDVDDSKLYTQPEEVAYAYEELSKISSQFTIAAAFGNVHGVYKPGNVKLTPKILKNSQEYISKKYGVEHNHIDFVFHGGSGSTVEEIREGISYGVIKMNIDTDLQYAFMTGIRDYMGSKADYLKSQIGNPEGTDVPNKKHYDPRVWLREGEKTFVTRLKKAFEDLNNVNTL